jgi:plastocyanin
VHFIILWLFKSLIKYAAIYSQIILYCAVSYTFGLSNLELAYAAHCIQYDPSTHTIALLCGTADLFDILDNLGPNQALNKEANRTWVLNANLVVGNSATLDIDSNYTSWLKINSTDTSNPFHIHVLGNMHLESVKISSWDFTSDTYGKTSDLIPRPYITVLPGATGETVIIESDISFLGYDSPLREGLSFYGGQVKLVNNTIHDQYYGIFNSTRNLTVNNNIFYNNIHNFNLPIVNNLKISPNNSTDNVLPFVSIRYPAFNSTIPYKNIMIEGTAIDEQTGVTKVEVFEHTFPFDNQFPYELSYPLKNGSWSKWHYHFNINESGVHRISARVTDVAGNENWSESLFKTSFNNGTIYEDNSTNSFRNRFAVVDPVFTSGAYNDGGFYQFYPKYANVSDGTTVKTDLDLLTSQIPDNNIESKKMTQFLLNHLSALTNMTVYDISDEDVDAGYIFEPDGSNAFDVLFLLHNEYVTDKEYNNFKRFVSNGGTIVFLDGNVLYAEVQYDNDMHTVTLVKGHDWDFDGKAALKSDHEAYFDDKKGWVGSNFLYGDISAPVRFIDNPFNYTHFEENYVSNPNATILYDYGAQIPGSVLKDNNAVAYPKIATYELSYGKGKVIMLGLYTQHLFGNEAFMDFFDRIILPRALGHPFKYGTAGQNESVVYWRMNTGNLSGITVDNQSNTVTLNLERSEQRNDTLFITLPGKMMGGGDPKLLDFNIRVNDKEVNYNQTPDDLENGFEIPLSANATKVQISVIGNNTDRGLGLGLGTESLSKSIQNGSVLGRGDNASGAPKIQIVEGAYSVTSTESFKPSTVSIPPGTAVTWTNDDVETHTITSGNLDSGSPAGKLFDSGYLAPRKTYEHAFTDKGIFDYFCRLHPFMKGTVIVK